MPQEPKLLTPRQVASRLAIDVSTVHRYIANGRLDALRLGDADTAPLRVPADALERFLADAWRRQVERRGAAA